MTRNIGHNIINKKVATETWARTRLRRRNKRMRWRGEEKIEDEKD